MTGDARQFLPREQGQSLLAALQQAGYRCMGPRVRDGAVVYEDVADFHELPNGWRDEQQPGHYRVQDQGGPRTFAWANGPQALKPLLFSPSEPLWTARQRDSGLHFEAVALEPEPKAVIGVRACDLAALRIHDQHFLHSGFADPYYASRRQGLFLVAVNCSHPAATCFCASTGDGPEALEGYDLVLGELDEGFVIHAGSEAGSRILAALPTRPATPTQLETTDWEVREAGRQQTRELPSRQLNHALFNNLEHPRWQDVAERCLSCGNCTSVCPTCFCHSETDVAALDGQRSDHYRQWDSCFTQGHSYLHGIVIRPDTPKRYRQWLTHKLGSWHEQYGRSGCVGCGRCIAWCPVGIDITEEATAICGEWLERESHGD